MWTVGKEKVKGRGSWEREEGVISIQEVQKAMEFEEIALRQSI